ncbi:hypothetical protein CN345_18355 [Bacillus thuringiensis]|uniref:hypothetical protein n=1 Tax=Bacillus thuringiensis TaxID=1428 RepID=UPI000BF5BD74|nr:hypothetical protein [Bacillus thuringiensis]PES01982.1 hypothetical protein CN488_30765 [Bacillus anthracis]PEZ30227.1 hypothetical protein CN345_18355 [Bacillus thuringiensis]PGY56898.1 hypothetical protein COE09_12610 [Bacillus thuringiensis]
MFKRIFTSLIIGSLCITVTGCTSYITSVATSSSKIYTPYTNEDLYRAFPVGMPIDTYISKKNVMPVKHISSIQLTNRDVGRVLQTKDGFVIICGNEKEIFDVKTFPTMEDVQNYEDSLQK